MAVRTTSDLVKSILMNDYGPKLDGTLPSLTPYIDSASVIVDRVVSLAASRGTALTTGEAELVERWLAAHIYVQVDQPYSSKSTEGASASFQGQPSGLNLDNSKYGQTAKMLDYSGCLTIISKRQTAGSFGSGYGAASGWDNPAIP